MPRHGVSGSCYSATNGGGPNVTGAHAIAFVFDFYPLDWSPDISQPLESHVGAHDLQHGNGRIPDDRVDELKAGDAHVRIDGARALLVVTWPQGVFESSGGKGQLYLDMRRAQHDENNQHFQGDEEEGMIELLIYGEFGGPFADFKNLGREPTKHATIDISTAQGSTGGGPTMIQVIETGQGSNGGLHAEYKIQTLGTQGMIFHRATVSPEVWTGGDLGPLQLDGSGEVSKDFVYNWPERHA